MFLTFKTYPLWAYTGLDKTIEEYFLDLHINFVAWYL